MFSVLSACSVFLTIRSFQAMVMIMDEVVGNITQAFKVKLSSSCLQTMYAPVHES